MYRFSRSAKIFVIFLLVILGVGAFFFWPKNTKKDIAGAETQVDPNHPVEIYYGNQQLHDLDAMLADLAVEVFPQDKVQALPYPGLGLGSQITIARATPVELTDAKVTRIYRTWATSIKDLLVENNLELLDQDSVAPSAETPIAYAMKIKITRVAEFDLTQKEPINFQVIKKYNSSMEKGTKNILQTGRNGEKSVTYHVKRVDGEETSRKITNTEVLSDPTNEIVEIGTWVKVFGEGAATWYGVYPRVARLAGNAYYAASKTIPYGTVVWVINTDNGKGVKVTVCDWVEADVAIDLSKAAFSQIANLGQGVINVRIEKYYPN